MKRKLTVSLIIMTIAVTFCVACDNAPTEPSSSKPDDAKQSSLSDNSSKSLPQSSEGSSDATITSDSAILGTEDEKDLEDTSESNSTVLLKTPMSFAKGKIPSEFPDFAGKTIILELVDGEYDRKDIFHNSMWSGNFQYRLTDDLSFDNELEHEENDIITKPFSLRFNFTFPLIIDDYNNDQQPDFAITQFGSSSGGDYCAIYTITDSGEVEPLPFKGDGRYISSFGLISEGENETNELSYAFLLPYSHEESSPQLKKIDEKSFEFTYYAIQGLQSLEGVLGIDIDETPKLAQLITPTVRDIFQWKDEAFYLVRHEILDEDGTVLLSIEK